MIVTYFGFRSDGSSMFLQASGKLENDRIFRADLMEYSNGRSLVGPPRSGEPAQNHGEILIDFKNTTNGTVQLPGDGVRSISRYVFENPMRWFSYQYHIAVGPYKLAEVLFKIDGDHMKMIWTYLPSSYSSVLSECELTGNFIRAGKGYRSDGTIVCKGNPSFTGPYRLEDLAVDEYGALSGRLYEKRNEEFNSITLLTGTCVSWLMLSSPKIQCVSSEPAEKP